MFGLTISLPTFPNRSAGRNANHVKQSRRQDSQPFQTFQFSFPRERIISSERTDIRDILWSEAREKSAYRQLQNGVNPVRRDVI